MTLIRLNKPARACLRCSTAATLWNALPRTERSIACVAAMQVADVLTRLLVAPREHS